MLKITGSLRFSGRRSRTGWTLPTAPTARLRQQRWIRLLAAGLGVCVGRCMWQRRSRGRNAEQRGIAVANPTRLLAHCGLADRGTRPAGYGPCGPRGPGHRSPELLRTSAQRARDPPRLPGVRTLLAGLYRQRRPRQRLGDEELRLRAGRHRPPGPASGESGPDRRGAAGRPSPRQCRSTAAPGHREAAVGHDLRACRRRLVAGRGRQDIWTGCSGAATGSATPWGGGWKATRANALPTAAPPPICCRRLWPTPPASPPWPLHGQSCSARSALPPTMPLS